MSVSSKTTVLAGTMIGNAQAERIGSEPSDELGPLRPHPPSEAAKSANPHHDVFARARIDGRVCHEPEQRLTLTDTKPSDEVAGPRSRVTDA